MISKRRDIIDQLREDRADEGSRAEASPAKKAEPEQQSVQADKGAQEQGSPGTEERRSSPEQSRDAEPSKEQASFLQREREVAQAQARISEAQTAAEKRSAKAEADEAKAQAALEKLKWAKSDPIGFLSELGWSEDDWKTFLANGGKVNPEVERMKAMEAKFAELEGKHRDLEAKAEASARKAALDAENQAFNTELQSYTFVPKIMNMDQVRMKQHELSRQSGSQISLKQAADVLEKELHDSLQPLLKFEDVRSKLGLSNRDQSSVDKPPQDKTQNGKAGAKAASEPSSDPEIEGWNWAERKRRALKTLAKASL